MKKETKVLAAFSGGPDSAVLLELLFRAYSSGEIGALAAAHYHHGIRGEEADRDAEFCREFCASRGIPFFTERGNVPAFAEEHGLSEETAARELRYGFLRRIRAERGFDVIALGHHTDDQTETVLMHLIRGTGLNGLCGMRTRSGDLIRPLLHANKSEIIAFAASEGIPWCHDSTNDGSLYRRNRVRSEILPILTELNPDLLTAVSRMAELLQSDADCLQAFADRLLEKARRGDTFDTGALLDADESIRRRALYTALRPILGYDIKLADVRRVEELLSAQSGTAIELPHGTGAAVYEQRLYLGTVPRLEPFSLLVPSEGEYETPFGRFSFRTDSEFILPKTPFEACVDASRICWPLELRSPRPGDRFLPLNGPGSRKISDILVDRKVPVPERVFPLLYSGEQAVWMPGYTISDSVKSGPDTKTVLHIKLYKSREEQHHAADPSHGR